MAVVTDKFCKKNIFNDKFNQADKVDETSLRQTSPNSTIRGKPDKQTPNPIDVHVGNRIRLRRNILGFSQQYLARFIGLTFQQIQKYEAGLNRVGASRLWDISRVLNVSMDYFFQDMNESTINKSPMMLRLPNGINSTFPQNMQSQDPMNKKETLELVDAYYKIHNRYVAGLLFNIMKALSGTKYPLTDNKNYRASAETIRQKIDAIIGQSNKIDEIHKKINKLFDDNKNL